MSSTVRPELALLAIQTDKSSDRKGQRSGSGEQPSQPLVEFQEGTPRERAIPSSMPFAVMRADAAIARIGCNGRDVLPSASIPLANNVNFCV